MKEQDTKYQLEISERVFSEDGTEIREIISQYLNLKVEKILCEDYDRDEVRAISSESEVA